MTFEDYGKANTGNVIEALEALRAQMEMPRERGPTVILVGSVAEAKWLSEKIHGKKDGRRMNDDGRG